MEIDRFHFYIDTGVFLPGGSFFVSLLSKKERETVLGQDDDRESFEDGFSAQSGISSFYI